LNNCNLLSVWLSKRRGRLGSENEVKEENYGKDLG
jgi:hypothetical protein